MFPDDQTLIARGKHATLSKERRVQLERVQTTCRTIMHLANQVLRDCEERPPTDPQALASMEKCVGNVKDARERIVKLCAEMEELYPSAWDASKQTKEAA